MSVAEAASWAAGRLVARDPALATLAVGAYGGGMAALWTLVLAESLWTWQGPAHALLFFITAISPLALLTIGYTAALADAERRG